MNKLTARGVAAISKPGRHSDGGGLYLVIDANGSKRWVYLFRRNGKLSEMGLGGLSSVSLSTARELAAHARKMLASGRNPIDARREANREEATGVSFGEFADALLKDIETGYRSAKHRDQWEYSLTTLAAKLRPRPIDKITTQHVLEVLNPIWKKTPETASRLRGRIERVLEAARAKGLRSGDNPARWRGQLDALLPRRQKVQRGHHAAMPYTDVPAFVAELRKREAVAALMLEFTILTASRTGEVTGATWPEIDLTAKVWTIPAARMKAGRIHRVPLSNRCLEILTTVEPLRTSGDFVFPGHKTGRPFSNMAMAVLLHRRMDREGVTVHGFRSAFRDWAGEATNFPRELAEAALAHVFGNEVERAYRRGDALERRRKLMEAWANFINVKAGNNASLHVSGRSNQIRKND
ncbi:integrase [Ancylobacter sp. 3268]|uniref:tyrosine-type recombinase/integrase n=1 Tax=Ancylobacter sp. 3268 TaxID=2817752 RepID=UPI0028602B90|nr:integrase arm-type DNA-binding domain-containing protein [Ancylobacter sp. 3268]MDR6955904.1 integrase [Ancylobacter sp. 3268]